MSARCKACEADVMWVQMETGGRMLVNLPPEKRIVITVPKAGTGNPRAAIMDTYVSHFATCPKADDFRRKHEN